MWSGQGPSFGKTLSRQLEARHTRGWLLAGTSNLFNSSGLSWVYTGVALFSLLSNKVQPSKLEKIGKGLLYFPLIDLYGMLRKYGRL